MDMWYNVVNERGLVAEEAEARRSEAVEFHLNHNQSQQEDNFRLLSQT